MIINYLSHDVNLIVTFLKLDSWKLYMFNFLLTYIELYLCKFVLYIVITKIMYLLLLLKFTLSSANYFFLHIPSAVLRIVRCIRVMCTLPISRLLFNSPIVANLLRYVLHTKITHYEDNEPRNQYLHTFKWYDR